MTTCCDCQEAKEIALDLDTFICDETGISIYTCGCAYCDFEYGLEKVERYILKSCIRLEQQCHLCLEFKCEDHIITFTNVEDGNCFNVCEDCKNKNKLSLPPLKGEESKEEDDSVEL
jgi:hypothetical protein